MVVLTQYDFDAEAWRAEAPPGPAVVAVEVGAGDLAENWARLGPLGGPRLSVRPDAPVGVRRITVSGPGWDERRTLQLGAITLTSA